MKYDIKSYINISVKLAKNNKKLNTKNCIQK